MGPARSAASPPVRTGSGPPQLADRGVWQSRPPPKTGSPPPPTHFHSAASHLGGIDGFRALAYAPGRPSGELAPRGIN